MPQKSKRKPRKPKRLIIGLTGYKGSGKNTAAECLNDFRQVSFAHPLREVCKTVFGLTDEEMSDRVLKEKPLSRWPYQSPRRILQTVGTDMFRKMYPGTWIEHFRRNAESFQGNLVVTDVRFADECDTIKEMGGYIIRIVRPGQQLDSDSHESERAIDSLQIDHSVINSGTTDELSVAINELVEKLN